MLSRFIVLIFGLSVVLGGIQSHVVNEQMSSIGRAKRGGEQYTVEVVVAVDNEMVDYYGDELYDVVMTAMNLTSDVYQKSNLKQSISVSVLELIQLPFPTSDFENSPGTDGKNAQKMLTKFCDYMKSTTLKYDAAALITRSKIYTDASPPAGINGLSNIGAMCDPDACLILADSFILTNWVAAHELGHTFGAEHDEHPSCAKFPQVDGKAIMNANVGQVWKFSPCSQNAVDELLKKDKSKCLTEQIGPNKLDGITKNPKLFSVSRQCKEWLQDNYNTAAPFREATKKGDCTQMWCPRKDGNDGTNFAPWANGTPCGDNKVCQYVKCVDA